MLYEYEPQKYKAMIKWLGDVYIYQGVKCEWDEDYMKDFYKMSETIEKRRQEMIEKFR